MIRLTPERARALKIVVMILLAIIAAPIAVALVLVRASEARR